MRLLPAAFSIVVLSTSLLSAQSVVAPAAYASTRGNGSVTTLTQTGGRTWMLGIAASELASIPVGSIINGVSFRPGSTTATSWPAVAASWVNYEITVGNVIPLATWTGTFASNFTGTPVQVRAGAMVIEPGAFTSVATTGVQAWSDFYWDFQKPFVYLGGDLGVLFTHSGNNSGTSYGLDYTAATVTQTTAWLVSSYQASTGAAVHVANVTRVHYGHGQGCAGSGGMTPNLVLSNNTVGGGKIAVSLANAPASSPAALVLGGVRVSTPLPNGCTLLLPPLVVLPVTLNAYGRNLFAFVVPTTALGIVELQGVVIDAGATGGYTLSNGTTLTAN